jgi:hypothetical protein
LQICVAGHRGGEQDLKEGAQPVMAS